MILSPVDAGTLYSFSFIPSIMYRIESVLLASYLKISSGSCANNDVLPVNKGFIRNKEFNPRQWIATFLSHSFLGDYATSHSSSKLSYNMGTSYMKNKVVADVVEALIGAYLTTKGESGALAFMQWLGLDINIHTAVSNKRVLTSSAETYVNVKALESLLNHSFRNPLLLVEALTHGSYQVPDIPRCYQRLEFLGDAVLNYLITVHMYNTYPELSPGLLTDLRSASVNNNCYAHAAVKAGLNKHILHASPDLPRHMEVYSNKFSKSFPGSSHGWEVGVALPKVLGDFIESLAGAILVDCGFDKEIVWQSLRPLLEPLITLETMKYHPVRELEELCSRKDIGRSTKPQAMKGIASITVESKLR